MSKKRLELSTNEGVQLLEFVPSDARQLFELIDQNRDHISQYDEPAPESDIDSVLHSITHPENPDGIRFGIWFDGVLVGTINLWPVSIYASEIDYWISERFCSKGLATVATKAVIEFSRQFVRIKRIIGRAHVNNYASQKVLLNAGMTKIKGIGSMIWFSIQIKHDKITAPKEDSSCL